MEAIIKENERKIRHILNVRCIWKLGCLKISHWNFGIKILLLFGLNTKFMKRAFYLCVTLTKFFNPPKPLAPHVLNGVIYLYYLLQKVVVRVR